MNREYFTRMPDYLSYANNSEEHPFERINLKVAEQSEQKYLERMGRAASLTEMNTQHLCALLRSPKWFVLQFKQNVPSISTMQVTLLENL